MNTYPTQKKKFLFIPANPTPNGRLHLGHIAGPYLRLDMYSRYLKTCGHTVHMMFGTDAFDSHVDAKASKLGHSANELATQNYELIQEDLRALNIGVDAFVNPLSDAYSSTFTHTHQAVMNELEARNLLMTKSDPVPYSVASNTFPIPAEVHGYCPNCQSPMAGYGCESCGLHLPPKRVGQLKDKRGADLKLMRVEQVFVQTEKLRVSERDFEHQGLAPEFKQVIADHFQHVGGYFRLTNSTTRGVPWKNSILLNSSHLFAYMLFLGELYAQVNQTTNPIEKRSDVHIVSGFGIDNVVPHVIHKRMMSKALPTYKHGDSFIINHFLLLEGEKFSTSRGHAIWASDIIEDTPVQSDGLRLYMAHLNTSKPNQSFDIESFVRYYNDAYLTQIVHRVMAAFDHVKCMEQDHKPSAATMDEAKSITQAIDKAFDPTQYDTTQIAHILTDFWMDYTPDRQAYWRLKSFCVIGYSVLPDLCQELWTALGETGIPLIERLLMNTAIVDLQTWHVTRLHTSDLNNCLPETLRTHNIQIHDTTY